MRDPRVPDPSQDEYIPEADGSHASRAVSPVQEGINPTRPSTMPRAEDDRDTAANSPEFNDRPGPLKP